MTDTKLTPIVGELDPEIAPIVHFLRKHEVDTIQSCQGGKGHPFREPIVEFRVNPNDPHSEIFRVINILLDKGMKGGDLNFSLQISVTDGKDVSYRCGRVEFLGGNLEPPFLKTKQPPTWRGIWDD